MNNFIIIRKHIIFLVVGMLAGLQGCAVPGFTSVSSLNAELTGQKGKHYLGYAPVVESQPTYDGEVPPGAITPISFDLVRAQKMSKKRDVPLQVRSLFGKAPQYTIAPGDVIGILIYDHPELLPNAGAVISQQTDPTGVSVAPGFIVGSSGEVSFPYIGRIKIEGLNEIEASDLIRNKISLYIKDPQVTVRIQAFRSRRVYMEGEFRTPGTQIFTDVPMTLAEAISRAGGITANGDRSSVTLTRDGKTTAIDLVALLEAGADASNIPLISGDVVNVRNRDENKVYVMGEVSRPSALLMHNGKLSLNEALGEAGGPSLGTSDPSQIYVIRSNGDGLPNIFHLDAKNPALLALAEGFSLKPRDVVYIDPVPLVKWNRIFSLILPSAQIANLTSATAAR